MTYNSTVECSHHKTTQKPVASAFSLKWQHGASMESRDYRFFAFSVRSRSAQLMGQKSPAIRKDADTDNTRSDRPACLLGTGTGGETKVEAPHCRMNSSLMGTLGLGRERAGSHSTLAEVCLTSTRKVLA